MNATAIVLLTLATVAPTTQPSTAPTTAPTTRRASGPSPAVVRARKRLRQIVQSYRNNVERAPKLYRKGRVCRDPILKSMLLEKSVECGLKALHDRKCIAAVESSLAILWKHAPDRRTEWMRRRAELYRRLYRRQEDPELKDKPGKKLLDVLLDLGQAHRRAKRWGPALRIFREGRALAALLKQEELESQFAAAIDSASFQRDTERKIAKEAAALKADPDDTAARERLIRALLIDRNAPAEAAKLLRDDLDDSWKTLVPLAVKPVDQLADGDARKLGDWYHKILARRAARAYRPTMLRRAKTYYRHFLETKDLKSRPSREVVDIVRGILKKLPADNFAIGGLYIPSVDMVEFAKVRDQLPRKGQIDALGKKLSEINPGPRIRVPRKGIRTRGGKIVRLKLTRRRAIASVEPLLALPLERLSLNDCGALESLNGLQGMPLQNLSLYGCRSLKSLAPLKDMPIRTLGLAKCSSLTDLSALKSLSLESLDLRAIASIKNLGALKGIKLKKLNLTGCVNLESIEGLEGMPLEELNLRNCRSITSIAGLKSVRKLQILNLNGCTGLKSLEGIEALRLTFLDVRGVSLSRKDQARIRKVRTLKTLHD